MTDDGNRIVVSDDGSPMGVLNIDIVQAEGTALSYSLAAAAGDPADVQDIAAKTLMRVGQAEFGYIAAVAARQLAEGVIGPLLEVIDTVKAATGLPAHDLRAGLAESRDYALAVAATLRAAAAGGDSLMTDIDTTKYVTPDDIDVDTIYPLDELEDAFRSNGEHMAAAAAKVGLVWMAVGDNAEVDLTPAQAVALAAKLVDAANRIEAGGE